MCRCPTCLHISVHHQRCCQLTSCLRMKSHGRRFCPCFCSRDVGTCGCDINSVAKETMETLNRRELIELTERQRRVARLQRLYAAYCGLADIALRFEDLLSAAPPNSRSCRPSPPHYKEVIARAPAR